MIYIIDDKPDRQKDLFPNLNKTVYVKLIHKYVEELDVSSKEVFDNANLIAIHDSFFKNPINRHSSKSEDIIRKDLKEYCHKKKILLVFFSGDYVGYFETIDGLECQVSVTRFYTNLKIFIAKIENGEEPALQILGFGENYRMEAVLNKFVLLMNKIESNDIYQARIFLTDLCFRLGIKDHKHLEALLNSNTIAELISKIDPFLLAYYENISN